MRASAMLALTALALAPLAGVEIPALVDYPNHLARMSILARHGTAAAHPDYQVVWGLYPNLALDLVVPPLSRLIGVEAATRAFLLASLCLVIGGAVAIEVAHKGRFELSLPAALLFIYAMPFAWGFLSFTFGLGLALCGIAASLATARSSMALRLALHAAAVPLLYASHLVALGLFGFAVGLIELWRVRSGRTSWLRAGAIGLAMAVPTLTLVVATLVEGGALGGRGSIWGGAYKLTWLFAMNGFSWPATFAGTALLGVALYVGVRQRRLRLTGPGPLLAVGFAALFIAMPFRLLDTAFVDVRVLVAAALILPAFLTIRWPDAKARALATSAAVALIGLNVATAWGVQAEYAGEYRRLIASFDLIGRNARVLVAHSEKALDPPPDLGEYPIHHAPTLAAAYADAFVPTVFADAGKQPLRPRAHVAHLSVTNSGPEPIDVLKKAALDPASPAVPRYLVGWPAHFDVLYVVGPIGPNPMPDRLTELTAGERWTLYRIRRVPPGAR